MRNFVLLFALMFSGTLFAQQGSDAEIEQLLKITDEEYREHVKEELELTPPKLLPFVCEELESMASVVSTTCQLQSDRATELQNKACARAIQLMNITVEECKIKLKSLGDQQ